MALQDIYSIAHRHLDGVRKAGHENILAFCPFHHNVSTPAFSMSLRSGLWVCFSCKESGNLYSFLHRLGISHGIIQGQYKYVLEEAEKSHPNRPQPLHTPNIAQEPLPEAFLGLFDLCPHALLDEGFEPELLRKFDVGFDQKHMRITYPLRDSRGNLVGISGRTVIDDPRRYKLYDREYLEWGLPERETPKSTLIWNAHEVFPRIFNQAQASLVLVEGFKACMWLKQLGVENVVALMGSYMSAPQQWLLEHTGAMVYLMFDHDPAGYGATEKIAEALRSSLTVKVVEYDLEKHQPSDLSPQEVLDALNGAIEAHLWAIRRT